MGGLTGYGSRWLPANVDGQGAVLRQQALQTASRGRMHHGCCACCCRGLGLQLTFSMLQVQPLSLPRINAGWLTIRAEWYHVRDLEPC